MDRPQKTNPPDLSFEQFAQKLSKGLIFAEVAFLLLAVILITLMMLKE